MTTTHQLDFLCHGYAGNFEQELASYVFDFTDYELPDRSYQDHLTEEQSAAYRAFLPADFYEDEDDPVLILDPFYGEYGHSLCELESIAHPETGETHNSVRVYIDEAMWNQVVSPPFLELLKERAQEFFVVYNAALPPNRHETPSFVGLVHTETVKRQTVKLV